jgi:peptidoglycan L-alanyl-D-glutamate endopeptidase CwlK
MDAAKIPFILTCTARTVKEQYALYAQGRQTLDEVNHLRFIARMPVITETENKYKVTSTLKSKHLIDLDDGDPNNDKSRAFDIAIIKDGKATWDLKVNVNNNEITDYIEAGNIGMSVGLVWGGSWTNFKDYPHFEESV